MLVESWHRYVRDYYREQLTTNHSLALLMQTSEPGIASNAFDVSQRLPMRITFLASETEQIAMHGYVYSARHFLQGVYYSVSISGIID
jgi:hypothetical protein